MLTLWSANLTTISTGRCMVGLMHVAPATWQQAFLSCHYEGAVLASPINSQLKDALRNIVRSSELDMKFMYIGANALFSPGDYISIEGVPLADMNVKWNSDYSGEKPEDCLSLSNQVDEVYTTSCDKYMPYVCYKKRDKTELNECGTFDNEYNLNETTGKCYKLHQEPRSWDVAYKICAAEGGHLAIINDKLEADVVTALFPELGSKNPIYQRPRANPIGEPAHIGLRNWNKDYTWLTIHGKKIENVYNTWAVDYPNDKGSNVCGCILDFGTLSSNSCTLELMFICEKDPHTSRFDLPEF